MTEGHEEYQRALREVLAPTLDYKRRWLELKVQIDHEISESEGALLEGYQYNIRDDFPFGKVVQGTLRKVLHIMEELEKS